MKNTLKIFNALIVISIWILIGMSALGLLVIHWELLTGDYSFSFSPEGINTYLLALGKYKALFTGTIATMAAYFGLHRLNAATIANVEKVKQDRFSEWKMVLDIRFIEIERKDPFMRREFVRIRYNLFERVHALRFNIDNRDQLTEVFNTTFRDLVNFFEDQNNRNIGMGGVYPSNTYSYSFDSFQFLFLGCVDNIYPAIVADLQGLYIAQFPAGRYIDPMAYQAAVRTYVPA